MYQFIALLSRPYLSGMDVMELMFVNGTTSVPKSILRFVSRLMTSTSALDFYKIPCYPLLLLLFPNKTSCEGGTSVSIIFPTLLWLGLKREREIGYALLITMDI